MKLIESYVPADTSQPVLETTVGSILRQAAAEAPDRLALVEGGTSLAAARRWTYAELLRDAETVARGLAARFEKGERVAVWAPNIPEWILLEYGAGLAGVVLVTVNPAYQPQELKYVLSQSQASGIFFLPSFRGNPMEESLEKIRPELPGLREVLSFDDFADFMASADPATALPEVSPDDPVQIQYTSGTTGFPKGAYLHHRGITNNSRFTLERLGAGPDSVYLNPMPLFHTAGCVVARAGLGARHRCDPRERACSSSPAVVLAALPERYRCHPSFSVCRR